MASSKITSISHSLDLEEDIKLFNHGKVVQHVGWVVWAIVLVLGIAGAFGEGMLSKRIQKGSGATIEYQYFLRRESEVPVTIHARVRRVLVQVAVPQGYMLMFRVEHSNPMPEKTESEGGYYVYSYRGKEDEPVVIRIFFIPQTEGKVQGTILVNGESFLLKHFIYP